MRMAGGAGARAAGASTAGTREGTERLKRLLALLGDKSLDEEEEGNGTLLPPSKQQAGC
jgi:hypothetical protein